MDRNRKLNKKYFNSESEVLQAEVAISEIEVASSTDGITSRWFEPIKLDGSDVWFIMIDETNPNHVSACESAIDYTEVPVSETETRQSLIEQLISAAAASDISIEFDRYYFNNRLTITKWIIDGGNGLTELITNASELWWDEKATPSSPTPREYAVKLLG